VQGVHVECQDQALGANALGTCDHHFLYVDWKLSVETPQQEVSNRTIYNYLKLQDPEILESFRTALAGEMQQWAIEASPSRNSLQANNLSESALHEGLDTMYSSLTSHISKSVSDTILSKVVGPNC
jgi:hypothetical protein